MNVIKGRSKSQQKFLSSAWAFKVASAILLPVNDVNSGVEFCIMQCIMEYDCSIICMLVAMFMNEGCVSL